MSVVAKMYCRGINTTVNGSVVSFSAVCRGEENKLWASATPSANLDMTILNKVAAEAFEVGEEYLVTFNHAPKG